VVDTDKIRVVIVDDIAETRDNIRKLLQFEPDVEVVGVARTGREAIDIAKDVKPDVLLMDINMPDMDGIAATEIIRKVVPFAQIVILSIQNDPNYMRRAMLAGARDFLTNASDKQCTSVKTWWSAAGWWIQCRRKSNYFLQPKGRFWVYDPGNKPGCMSEQ
jgi:DNA-binding NarL/FixJ family response regulator